MADEELRKRVNLDLNDDDDRLLEEQLRRSAIGDRDLPFVNSLIYFIIIIFLT